MNLLFRLLAVLCGTAMRRRLGLLNESVVRLRIFPNDLDLYRHVNNGRYLTLMDLGRMDLIWRTGLGRAASAHRLSPLVGAVTIRFLRPLFLFQSFNLRTRILGWDEKWFYIEQVFERRGHRMASAVVKGLFRGPQGNASPDKVLEVMGLAGMASPQLPDAVRQWAASNGAAKGPLDA